MAKGKVSDALRKRIRKELPEVEWIRDPGLRDKVVEAWSKAIAESSYSAIKDMRPSGKPDTDRLKRGTQTNHIRGVTRLAVKMGDEMKEEYPELPLDRDILVAGALCHDVGKPWEFDPVNLRRWDKSPHRYGWPTVRHPPYGVYICLSVGLPEEVAHIAGMHSHEAELHFPRGRKLARSLECTIVHYADNAWWQILRVGGLMIDDLKMELR